LNEEAFSRYHRAPFVGEFLGGYASVKQGGSNWVSWMVDDALGLHPNFLNLIGWQSDDALNFIRECPDLITRGSLQMGYRLVPTHVEYPSRIKPDVPFAVRSTWVNRGVGRALRDYQLTFWLVGPDGLRVAESNGHQLQTASWVKGETYTVKQRVSFPFAKPGHYRIAISLRDPNTSRPIALPLHTKIGDDTYPIGPVEVF